MSQSLAGHAEFWRATFRPEIFASFNELLSYLQKKVHDIPMERMENGEVGEFCIGQFFAGYSYWQTGKNGICWPDMITFLYK